MIPFAGDDGDKGLRASNSTSGAGQKEFEGGLPQLSDQGTAIYAKSNQGEQRAPKADLG